MAIVFDLSLNATEFLATAGRANDALKSIQSQGVVTKGALDGVAGAFDALSGSANRMAASTDKAATGLVGLSRAAATLAGDFGAATSGVAAFDRTLAASLSNVRAMATAMTTLGSAARSASTGMGNAGVAANTLGSRFDAASNRATALGTNLGRVNIAAGGVGASMARAATGLASFSTQAQAAATSMASLMRGVQAQSQAALQNAQQAAAAMAALNRGATAGTPAAPTPRAPSASGGRGDGAGFLATLRDLTVVAEGAHLAMEGLRYVTEGWIGAITETNAQVQSMTLALAGLSTARDPIAAANAQIHALREEAMRVPFSIEAIHGAFMRMSSAGVENVDGVLHALENGLAALGGTDGSLGRASLAIAEMSGKGVVSLKELRNQLGVALPGAAKLMAQAFGVSYSELMSDIHTGTVDAKASIEALRQQLEITYGGAAARQMTTFSGQLAVLKTNYFNLATVIGNSGYFAEITKQLTDLNTALQGRAGAQFAAAIGSGLLTAVQSGRALVETMIRFRTEIVGVAEALAAGFAMKLAIAGVVALRTEWAALAAVISSVSVATQAAQAAQAANNLRLVGIQAVAAATGVSAGFAGASTALANFGIRIASGASLLMRFTPLLVTAGVILYTVAQSFGVLGDKAAEAYEKMHNAGARTAAEAREIAQQRLKDLDEEIARNDRLRAARSTGDGKTVAQRVKEFAADPEAYLKDRSDRLDARAADRLSFARQNPLEFAKGVGTPTDEYTASVQKERTRVALDLGKDVETGRKNEAAGYVDEQVKAVTAGEQAIRAAHNETRRQLADAYDAQVKVVTAAGRSTADAQKEYSAKLLAVDTDQFDKQIDLVQARIDKETELRDRQLDDDKKAKSDALVAELKQQQDALRQERQTRIDRPAGVAKSDKEKNDAKLAEAGEKQLERLRESAAQYTATIEGADGALAKLKEQIANGDFGDPTSMAQPVQILLDKIARAKSEVDDLKKIMDGKAALDTDVNAARQKALDDAEKLAHPDETPSEAVARHLREGKYAGYGGSDDEAKRLEAIRKGLDTASSGGLAGSLATLSKGLETATTGGAAVGDALKTKAFGSDTQSAVEKVKSDVDALNGAMQTTADKAAGVAAGLAKMGGASSPFGTMGNVQKGSDGGLTPAVPSGPLNAAFGVNGPKVASPLSASDRDLLTRTLIGEAGGEGNTGMAAVANVIKNRVASGNYGDGYQAVIKAPKQFSMWNAGNAAGRMASAVPVDSERYQNAARIADLVTSGALGDPTNGATHYMNPRDADESAKRGWGARLAQQQSITIGNHVFLGKEVASAPWNGGVPSLPNTGAPMPTALTGVDIGPGGRKPDAAVNAPLTPGKANPAGAALAGAPSGISIPTTTPSAEADSLRATHEQEILNEQAKALSAMTDLQKKAATQIQQANDKSTLGMGSQQASAVQKIREGTLSSDIKITDPNSPVFASYLASLKQLDDANKASADHAKAVNAAEESQKSAQEGLNKSTARLDERFRQLTGSPNDPKLSNAYLGQVASNKANLDKQVAAGNGPGTDSYAAAEKLGLEQLAQIRNEDVIESATALRQKTEALNNSLLTQDEQQKAAHDKEIARMQAELAAFTGTAEQKAAISKVMQDNIAANDKAALAKSPIGQEMQQWSDFSKNMQTSIASSANTAIDGVAGMLVGKKTNWTSMLQNMAQSMISNVLKAGVGSMFQSMLGPAAGSALGKGAAAPGAAAAGGAKAAAVPAGGAAAAGGSKGALAAAPLAVAHTGGLVGSGLGYRTGSLDMFANAPRFHTGGIIGADEVPIIARKGEGVFTPEQMDAMGDGAGSGGVQVHAPVTFNATGGTKEQNADLAKQLGAHLSDHIRGVAVDEIRNQMRPGNMLNSNAPQGSR